MEEDIIFPALKSMPQKKRKVYAEVVGERKWQLKVYPLHAEDLQLSYMSILCKLASESLLYIPSEGRHGKAELYVATQKETAAIIGKLLRMDFHHNLLSIEVARKDTGGKDSGDESKKECKAFLMFDKFLSKKIFDAKGEKGTLIEKIVTLNKLPRAATKDFIGALFPFATDIEIIESDNPDERKATVKCKTPVTSLLVYKSFKRLEINDVHVKLTIDDSVKAITLPPMFFVPPPEKKDTGPPDSIESLNQSSLPRRPMMSSLNRRVLQIKKRALMTRIKPVRGPLMRNPRPNQSFDEQYGEGPRGPGPHRPFPRRIVDGNRFVPSMTDQGPGSRDYPGGPGRRRMLEKQNDRRNSRDRNNNPEYGGSSWSTDNSSRMDRGRNERVRSDRGRQERVGRTGIDRMDHVNRPDRTKRIDLNSRPDRLDGGTRDRGDRRSSEVTRQPQRGLRQSQTYRGSSAGDTGRGKVDRSLLNTSHGSEGTSAHGGRGSEYPVSGRSSQRNDGAYNSGSHEQTSGSNRYSGYSQVEGDNNSYYRRF